MTQQMLSTYICSSERKERYREVGKSCVSASDASLASGAKWPSLEHGGGLGPGYAFCANRGKSRARTGIALLCYPAAGGSVFCVCGRRRPQHRRPAYPALKHRHDAARRPVCALVTPLARPSGHLIWTQHMLTRRSDPNFSDHWRAADGIQTANSDGPYPCAARRPGLTPAHGSRLLLTAALCSTPPSGPCSLCRHRPFQSVVNNPWRRDPCPSSR
jgi:hypothetical protein